jgi:molybdate transport system substrate-binding protein
MVRWILLAAAAVLCAAATPDRAGAAEIKLLAPGATRTSLEQLIPQFERSSGHKVTVSHGPVGSLADRIKADEAADVVILGQPVAEGLRKLGKLVPGSGVVVAKVGVGVFVRKGDPKPDIGTVDAFLRAATNAKTISFADANLGGGSAATYLGKLMESLDVTGSIRPKIKMTPPSKPLADFVAGGGADFGMNQITEVLADPRLELVGPLPAQIQNYTLYEANVVATSGQQEPAKALIAFLASPEAGAVMRTKGFEPR